jgi:hypothetical protein
MFLNICETSFPIGYLTNCSDKSWITTGIKISCQHKRLLDNISKHSNNSKIKLDFKKYCLILRKVICEAKKQHYNQLIESSNNRNKIFWNVRNIFHKSARYNICLPRLRQMTGTFNLEIQLMLSMSILYI